ncbi:MAG: methyltransferase [Thermomicrobiales bacterium]
MVSSPPATDSPTLLPTILRLMGGYQVTQAVHVMARLRIADILRDGPLPVEAIAERCDADPDTLRRLLRALAGIDVLHLDDEGRYAITPLGALLRTDHPQSVWAAAELIGDPLRWDTWEDLYRTIRTGESAFERVHGMPLFAYLAEHPDLSARFDDVMTMSTRLSMPGVLDACDFSASRCIVDVGGGQGEFLREVLRRYPEARGIVFDLPHLREAREIAGTPEADRVTVVSGDMFESVPAGGDAYTLRRVLHDWPDDACRRLLRNCRQAIAPDGSLLVVDMVVPEDGSNAPMNWNDLHLLMMCGGKERTRDEFATLFAETGFRLVDVHPAGSVSVIEGVPV